MQFDQKRREFITLLGGTAIAWPLAARAQQGERMRRIGVLMYMPADDAEGQARLAALAQALKQLGWSEGRNLRIETRWANADDIRRHAAELAALAPDVLLAGTGTAAVAPLLQATRTLPIVFVTVIDPVGAGFVASQMFCDNERGREEMANRRHERTTSQAAQENRRGPATIGQAAQAAAALGEQAARASGNTARMAAGASEHAARAGADLFESTAGAVEQLWRSGLDIASHFAEQSSSQLARSMGLSDEKAQEAAERSSGNIDAIVQSSRAYADAFQGISRELSSLCRERMDRNLEKINDMMRSRSPQELIAAQSDLFRENLEGFLQGSRRVAEASVRVADQATRRLTKIIEKQRRAA